MTVRIIKGTVTHNGVPYWPHTSQNVIEDIDDDEARRLINLGVAERIDDLPKPPLQVFTESSEKIRAKLAELGIKLAEAESEWEALLDDGLEDVAGITKKIDAVNSRVNSLKALIQRQQAKLEKAEGAEAQEAEKATVEKLAEITKQQRKDAEKILNGISEALEAIQRHLSARQGLCGAIRKAFIEAGGGLERSPLLSVLALPETVEHLEGIQKAVKADLESLRLAADRTPEKLRHILNAKHYKTEDQLSAELRELRECERKKQAEPTTTLCEEQDDYE